MHKTYFKNTENLKCSVCGKFARYYVLIKERLLYLCDDPLCEYHTYRAWVKLRGEGNAAGKT